MRAARPTELAGVLAACGRLPGRRTGISDTLVLDLNDLITSDPEILGGARVFRGTRVPVEALFDNLAAGLSLNDVLDDFPSLDRADVVRVLELTSARLFPPAAA